MLRAHVGVLAAAAVWAGQLRGSSAQSGSCARAARREGPYGIGLRYT
eukprot:COSAG06_NODE_36639_length_444_cov_1.631884_2_plen_46_part_01